MGGIDSRIACEEFWSSVGYWILVAGLVGDIIVLVVPRHRERLEKLLAALFTIVIILGVAIEHRADSAISRLVSQQQVDTNLRIADAIHATETERLERVQLESLVSPRRLFLEQQQAIANSCRRFSGRVVIVSSYALDTEAMVLSEQIASALHAAGVKVVPNLGSILMTGRPLSGIRVSGPPSKRNIVLAIESSLKNDGHLEIAGPEQSVLSRPVGTSFLGRAILTPGPVDANIFVGVKPATVLALPKR